MGKENVKKLKIQKKDKLNAANISIKILMSKINRLENKIIKYEDTQCVFKKTKRSFVSSSRLCTLIPMEK